MSLKSVTAIPSKPYLRFSSSVCSKSLSACPLRSSILTKVYSMSLQSNLYLDH